ncbi:hypothetical protein LUZ60_001846 [Juncus effusus]|nr:hypothetical protein LUZ60_001846 [Juncus effusus]
MTTDSPKNLISTIGVRKSLTTILISVGALVFSLVVVSLFVFSSPSNSSITGYVQEPIVVPQNNEETVTKEAVKEIDKPGYFNETLKGVENPDSKETLTPTVDNLTENPKPDSDKTLNNEASSDNKDKSEVPTQKPSASQNTQCDIYKGKWVYDESGPLYTNNSCPIITQMQNCQGNGRPDSEYENWRWRPNGCDLPRFEPKKFLELMRGKTLAFVGDSVARNQMESLLCILWQVETPKNRGNRKMQRWFFRSTSTYIVRIWSSWLVHRSSDPVGPAPKGIDKVFLDQPDETFMDFVHGFDVLVLSSGHWFAKQSAYILGGSVVGGQLWSSKDPKESGMMRVNNIEAFGISVETVLTALAQNPNFTGLAIVRSYSPDHYEGGAWNTGGSCTGKTRPVTSLVQNGFTDTMYSKQILGFQKAVEKTKNDKRLRFMDVTEMFGFRPDGHPGPYRSPDPNKKTKRGPNGEPPPQDCLHWCMPGPIDTWNEIVLEIIRSDFEGGAIL